MSDPVNRPKHYTSHPSGVEAITVCEHMGFNLGNAMKYLWRVDLKGNALDDLRKARWFLDREISRRGGGTETPKEPEAAAPATIVTSQTAPNWAPLVSDRLRTRDIVNRVGDWLFENCPRLHYESLDAVAREFIDQLSQWLFNLFPVEPKQPPVEEDRNAKIYRWSIHSDLAAAIPRDGKWHFVGEDTKLGGGGQIFFVDGREVDVTNGSPTAPVANPSWCQDGPIEVRRQPLDGAQELVAEFHEKFGITRSTTPGLRDVPLRLALIREEASEICEAAIGGNLPEAVDGLCDLIYVCLGSAVSWGVELGPMFVEVHRSNLEKIGGGKRADGKIAKPEGWRPPDIAGELRKQGWDGDGRSNQSTSRHDMNPCRLTACRTGEPAKFPGHDGGEPLFCTTFCRDTWARSVGCR